MVRPPVASLGEAVASVQSQPAVSTEVGLTLVAVLAVVHLLPGSVRRDGGSRPRIVSAGGGASLAYVVVYMLPEVNEAVVEATESTVGSAEFFTRDVEVYVVVLAGFLTFYVVHVLASRRTDADTDSSPTVFWAHVASFAGYNALVGYLVFHQELPGLTAVVLYTVAMGLHFLVTDAGLRRHHGATYDRLGRWVLAGAIALGGLVGSVTEVEPGPLAVLFAFLAGSVVFNVTKEEVPDPESSRLSAFLFGGVGYTLVVLFI